LPVRILYHRRVALKCLAQDAPDFSLSSKGVGQ
jgi:hypothetical protein